MNDVSDFSDVQDAEPIAPLDAPLSDEAMRARVSELGPWLHNIQLAPGIATREIALSTGP